jgi:hypothetical protein
VTDYGVALGGVLYAIGCGLPWLVATEAFVGTISRSGIDAGGDGIVALVLGIVLALIGVVGAIGSRTAGGRPATILLAGICVAIAVFEMGFIKTRLISNLDRNTIALTNVGVGFWVMIIGGGLAAVSALVGGIVDPD